MTDPMHLAWSRDLFNRLSDGGTWGIPRSGLIFTKRDDALVLTARMPHVAEMPMTVEQLTEYQQHDYETIREVFQAAGVTVRDESND